MSKTITISASVDRLRTMIALDQDFYGTPEAYKPYIASRPSWQDDVVLATPYDLIHSEGWDEISDCEQPDCNGDCPECAQLLSMDVTV